MKMNTCRRTVLTVIVSIILIMSVHPASMSVYAETVTKENLVTKVSNPSNGIITFYINIPPGKSVKYSTVLIPHKRTGSLDTIAGSCKNKSKKVISKKITVKTKYYSNKYLVKAQYTAGPSRLKTVYKDEDKAVSALKSTVTSSKFVWNSKNIKKWKNGQRVCTALTFAITGAADLAVTKGYLSSAVSTIIGLSFTVGDFVGGGTIASTRTINTMPIKGWAYQIQCKPVKNGYTQYLIVYNAKGKIDSRYKFASVPVSRISRVLR